MNASRRIVSDTGPLISLEKLTGGYDFIRRLFDKLLIPPAVLSEIAYGQFDEPRAYLEHHGITDLVEIHPVSSNLTISSSKRLNEGEIQAISLASELGLPLLIEERERRRIAQNLNLHISSFILHVAT